MFLLLKSECLDALSSWSLPMHTNIKIRMFHKFVCIGKPLGEGME